MEEYIKTMQAGVAVCEEFALSNDFLFCKTFENFNLISVTIESQFFDELIDRMGDPWECGGFAKIELHGGNDKMLELVETNFRLKYEDFPPPPGFFEAA